MNKFLHCTLCFMTIWMASLITNSGIVNKNIYQVLLGIFVGILGGMYVRYIADGAWFNDK